jgi:hypothetical protein
LHEIKLQELADNKTLTQATLQIAQMLGMYQAELARVLGLQCGDIGDFAAAKKQLRSGSAEWGRARQFVTLYERLYQYFAGDAVAIYHWLRVTHAQLAAVPLLMMVDEGRLDELVTWFDTAVAGSLPHANEANP